MAAIDPGATPEHTGTTNGNTPTRAILKIVYTPGEPDDDDESDLDSEEEAMQMQQLLGGGADVDEDENEEGSSDDEEKNGGPSDPSKSKKARKEAAAAQLLKSMKQEDSDHEMGDSLSSPAINGFTSKNKGKGKASAAKEEESSDDEIDGDAGDIEELVLCTLDPNQVCLAKCFSFRLAALII